jgi:hypothetical protein
MENILIHAHSGWRWIVLILLLAAVVKMNIGWKGNKTFTAGDKKLALFAMVAFHIQFLVGWILFFLSSQTNINTETWSTPNIRFFTVEHSLMMTLAMVLITIGYSKSKKATNDKQRFKRLAIFYTISLILILASIPWPFREALGGKWF